MKHLMLIPILVLSACQSQDTTTATETAPITAQAPAQAIPAVVASPTPTPTAATPTGHFLYVGNYGDTVISVYEIQSDGSLTFVQDAGTLSDIGYLSLNTAGTTLYACQVYVGSDACNRIMQYAIDHATGELTNTTPGYSQSYFTALAAGATFSTLDTVTYSGLTFTIDSGRIDGPTDNYVAGNQPVTLLIH